MPNVLDKPAMLAALKSKAAALGLSLRDDGQDGLSGEIEAIRTKWFLGGRKAVYRMSCRLAEAERAVLFREAVAEKSWGMPPPTLSAETSTIAGWRRSGTRTDRSVGGGGSMDFAEIRNALEQATTEAGWRFRLEGGRLP
jgi:hypothetical protein